MVKALIGPCYPDKPDGPFGIRWRDFPEMDSRGGYSGSYRTFKEAADSAEAIVVYFCGDESVLSVQPVPNVNDRSLWQGEEQATA